MTTEHLSLHDIVGIRLVDAEPAQLAAVRRALRPLRPPRAGAEGEADVTIRFVDRIEHHTPVRAIGLDDAAYTDDAFLLGAPGASGWARIPFEDIGGPCEIVCERTLPRIPLLREIVHLRALAKGYVPTHASAVNAAGGGILTTGWTSGGKTGVLLSLMSLGCQFVGDDLVYVKENGRFFGLHDAISVKDYYLDAAPQFSAVLESRERRRLRVVAGLERALARVPGPLRERILPGRVARKLEKWARTGRTVHLTPERLFGADRCATSGRIARVLLTRSDASDAVRIEPMDPRQLAGSMASSSQHELLGLQSCYRKFRFAFPQLRNFRVETCDRRIEEILERALAGKPCYSLSHPYPASIPVLCEALAPLCAETDCATRAAS